MGKLQSATHAGNSPIKTACIQDLSSDGRVIFCLNSKTVFIEGALLGEEVDFEIVRKHRDYDDARISSFHTSAAERVLPKCRHYKYVADVFCNIYRQAHSWLRSKDPCCLPLTASVGYNGKQYHHRSPARYGVIGDAHASRYIAHTLAKLVGEVVGVEADSGLVAARARANAVNNDLTNANFYQDDLFEEQSHAVWRQQAYDRLLLDPPRSGARAILSRMRSKLPLRIMYIWCHPATLARDCQNTG